MDRPSVSLLVAALRELSAGEVGDADLILREIADEKLDEAVILTADLLERLRSRRKAALARGEAAVRS
jgi:hypothetical protein